MGMNYYYVATEDDVLRIMDDDDRVRQDKIHIGRSAHGWMFTFQARSKADLTDAYCGIEHISSFQEWRDVFAKIPGVIIDEDNRDYSVEDFLTLVEETKEYEIQDYVMTLGTRLSKNHYDAYGHVEMNAFKDAEGWCFITEDFS